MIHQVGWNRPCPKCGKMVSRVFVKFHRPQIPELVFCDSCGKKWGRLCKDVVEYYEKKYPAKKCIACNGSGVVLGATCSDCRGSGKERSYWPSKGDIDREIDRRW
jgi:ribosomal protein L32